MRRDTRPGPRTTHVFDQAFGHAQLTLVDLGIGHALVQLQGFNAAHLLGPAQGNQHQGVFQWPQQREVLTGMQHTVARATLPVLSSVSRNSA